MGRGYPDPDPGCEAPGHTDCPDGLVSVVQRVWDTHLARFDLCPSSMFAPCSGCPGGLLRSHACPLHIVVA